MHKYARRATARPVKREQYIFITYFHRERFAGNAMRVFSSVSFMPVCNVSVSPFFTRGGVYLVCMCGFCATRRGKLTGVDAEHYMFYVIELIF